MIAHSSSPLYKERNHAWVMVYLQIYPPPNRTHSLIRSGMPHIRLYSVSALMLSHARWRFLISACSVIAGSIMSSSLCTIAASSRCETGQSCCPVTHPCPKTLGGCPSTIVECWRRDELKHRLAGRSHRTSSGAARPVLAPPSASSAYRGRCRLLQNSFT